MTNENHIFNIKNIFKEKLAKSELSIIRLAGDASSRVYYRVIEHNSSWVVMCWEPFETIKDYPFLSVLNHFKNNYISVPNVIHIEAELGLLVLEDLGDLTLERKFWENQDQSFVLPFYKKTLDELFKIHTSATQDTSKDCIAFQIQFDTEKLLWEMNYAKKFLFEGVGQIQFNKDQEVKLQSIFNSICKILSSQPQVICHRDFHSRNVMIKLDKIKIIDFQDARLGPIVYDLVSLFEDSYVSLNSETKSELINYYFSLFEKLDVKEFFHGDFQQLYNLQILQRCFKACGSFASFLALRNDKRYTKYISPTLNKVAKTLLHFPEYSFFSEIILDNKLLQKDFEAM